MRYVIARTAKRRPTLQHVISTDLRWTLCGVDTVRWSKAWSSEPVAVILCMKCGAISRSSRKS